MITPGGLRIEKFDPGWWDTVLTGQIILAVVQATLKTDIKKPDW